MLLEKYRPNSINEIVGNKKQVEEIRSWIKNWKRGNALILHGPPGSGKSIVVGLIAKELCMELLEYSICNHPFSVIKEDVLKTMKQRGLFYTGKIILIDEIELMSSTRGLIDLIRKSEHPVILIAINPYERRLLPLRKSCKLMKFNKLRTDLITNFLIRICKKEGIKYDERAISQIARMANGDIRAALIDLDILRSGVDIDSIGSIGYREHKEDIFNTLKVIFKASNLKNIDMAIMNSDKSLEEIFLWLEENIPLEYKDPEEVAAAYDYLSKADIISSRIMKRQSFSLQKYFSFAAHGIAISKKKASMRYVMYRVPKIFYPKGNAVPEKIARQLHVSKREVDMDLIRLLAEQNPELLQKFGLDEDERETVCA